MVDPFYVALAIIPKFTGMLSCLGSGFCLYDIVSSKQRRSHPFPRLMAGMSFFDIIASFNCFLSTWPIPASSGIFWASGNEATCTAQGFFLSLTSVVPLYNFCLALYYLLVVTFKWKDDEIEKIEKWMHPIIAFLGLFVSISGLPFQVYNSSTLWCWAAPDPIWCENGLSRGGGFGECRRGEYAWLFRWSQYVSIAVSILGVMVIMAIVAFSAYRDERKTRMFREIHSVRHGDDNLRSMTNDILWQAFLFVTVFFGTWVFFSIITITIGLDRPVERYMMMCHATFVPMQGFWNALIYVRPRYVRYRRKHAKSHFSSFVSVIMSSIKTRSNISREAKNTGFSTATTSDEFFRDDSRRVPTEINTGVGRMSIEDDTDLLHNPIDYSASYLVESMNRINDSFSEREEDRARQEEAREKNWQEFSQQHSFNEEDRGTSRKLRDSVKLHSRLDEVLEDHGEFDFHEGITSLHSSWEHSEQELVNSEAEFLNKPTV